MPVDVVNATVPIRFHCDVPQKNRAVEGAPGFQHDRKSPRISLTIERYRNLCLARIMTAAATAATHWYSSVAVWFND